MITFLRLCAPNAKLSRSNDLLVIAVALELDVRCLSAQSHIALLLQECLCLHLLAS